MNFPFFKDLFQKKEKNLIGLDSILIKKLKKISQENKLDFFTNTPLYHHSKIDFISLILLDPARGFFIFEKKEWSYDELKNATVEKAQNQNSSQNVLSYQNTQDLIYRKLNEILHQDTIPIYNYLLMENLNEEEYIHLDDSFKILLPKNRIIFYNTKEGEILEKIQGIQKKILPSRDTILGNLFVQYAILDKDRSLHFCNKKQREFIQLNIEQSSTLQGGTKTGKSSIILLKAIFFKLNNPDKKVIIVKPTKLSADIFKKKLLETIEHAVVEIDLNTLCILTPIELVNLHLVHSNKTPLQEKLFIDTDLMKKNFSVADMILCDDIHFLRNDFLDYIQHIQKEKALVFVDKYAKNATIALDKSYTNTNRTVIFVQAHPHAKALQFIAKLLQTEKAKEILIISNSLSKEKLNEDLEFFIKDKALLLDSSKNLIEQDFDTLRLATYNDIIEIQAKHVIILDICFQTTIELETAFHLAKESVYLLYDEECSEIRNLKDKYENRKN